MSKILTEPVNDVTPNELKTKKDYEHLHEQNSTAEQSSVPVTDSHQHSSAFSKNACFYNSTESSTTKVPPNTILITNNYSSSPSHNELSTGLKAENIKQSSITIVTHNSTVPTAANTLNRTSGSADSVNHSTNSMPTMPMPANSPTVVFDRINICINNHFNDSGTNLSNNSVILDSQNVESSTRTNFIHDNAEPLKMSPKEKKAVETESVSQIISRTNPPALVKEHISTSEFANPGPSTSNACFANGQDVFVRRKDGKLYLGTISASARNQCLIKFDDNTEYWSNFDELKLLSAESVKKPRCLLCKNSTENVEVCQGCERGYHPKCTEGNFQKHGVWLCSWCKTLNGIGGTDDINKTGQPVKHKSQLPYNIDSLTWDTHHRVNMEQIYCYCGHNGEWYNKMLQCCKCQQWFHEKCVQCLEYPVYCGDRFYVFACSMCNYGTEFVRRIEMKWKDIVHLLLFNLTINHQTKYYHVKDVVVPYALDNWPYLQLQQNIQDMNESAIRDNIIKTLSLHTARFKCGREIKKRASVWGLRSRIPPPVPTILIPQNVDISEPYLRQNMKVSIVLARYLAPIPKNIESKMFGIGYIGENSDNEMKFGKIDTSAPVSDDELVALPSKKSETTSSESRSSTNGPLDSSDLSHDCGDFKESAIKEDDSMDISDAIKIEKQYRSCNKRKRKSSPFLSTALLHQVKTAAFDVIDICDSSDETSSRGTLDLIIPPPKNFQGRNNPFRVTPKKAEHNPTTIINKKGDNRIAIKKGGIVTAFFRPQNKTTGSIDKLTNAAGQFGIIRTVKRRLSAKDIMIGPNQEIKRRRIRRRSGDVEVISTATIQTLPKSATYLPIRTDSKDVSLSSIRSSLNSVTSSSSPSSTSQMTISSSLQRSSNTNGRRLRQRQIQKSYAENPRRNSNTSLNGSGNSNSLSNVMTNLTGINALALTSQAPIKPGTSLSDLKNSVNKYFGAANRIADGEKFSIKAKRLTPSGRVHYLIEWDSIA